MKIKHQLDYDNLIKIYVFANTGNFLLKHFRTESSLYEFAKSINSPDLISLFNKTINHISSIYDLINVYSYIVSLTFKNYNREIQEFYEKLDDYKIEWVWELGVLCNSYMKAETNLKINYNYNSYIINNKMISSSDSTIIKISKNPDYKYIEE